MLLLRSLLLLLLLLWNRRRLRLGLRWGMVPIGLRKAVFRGKGRVLRRFRTRVREIGWR